MSTANRPAMRQVCVSKEFTKLATGETTPIAVWLRSLPASCTTSSADRAWGARHVLHRRLRAGDDGRSRRRSAGAGQPSTPFAIGRKRAATSTSPPPTWPRKERAAGGCEVLGLRYRKDPAVGNRFDTLTRELGDASSGSSSRARVTPPLTAHRQQEGVDRVLDFFAEKLRV